MRHGPPRKNPMTTGEVTEGLTQSSTTYSLLTPFQNKVYAICCELGEVPLILQFNSFMLLLISTPS